VLNRHDIPERLPKDAEEVLRALRWDRSRAGRNPPEHWFTTLRDAARPGPVRPEITDLIALLSRRPAARGRISDLLSQD